MSTRGRLAVATVVAGCALAWSPASNAATVTVSTTADASNGDVSSVQALIATPGADGISLREAITATNNTPGGTTINFSAALAGETIALTTTLPPIARAFTSIVGPVDGLGDSEVTIDVAGVATGFDTLSVQASYVTIGRLRFTGNHSLPGPTLAISVTAGDNGFAPDGPLAVRGTRVVENEFITQDAGLQGIDGGMVVGATNVQTPGTVKDVVIARNTFDGAGMNVVGESGTTVEDVTIAENAFSDFEDGIEIVESGDANRISRTRVTGNEFTGGNGSIFIGILPWVGPTSGNVIEDTVIERNRLLLAGGLNVIAGDDPGADSNAIEDTQVVNNLIDSAILIRDGDHGADDNAIENFELTNNTLSSETVYSPLQVARNQNGSTGNTLTGLLVHNTIFRSPMSTDMAGDITPSQVHHSITCDGGFSGVNGNVCADPLLVDPGAGDYHLLPGSPAIDAGTSSDAAPTSDLECRARHDDPATTNTGAGTPVYFDIGAYEYGAAVASCAALDTEPPASVTSLAGIRGVGSIALTWDNPADADLAAVMVRRAQGQAAPETPEEGSAVYEGTGESATPTGLSDCEAYSFSAFARDSFPNYVAPATLTVPAPSDPDGDGHGNACDPDDDGDGRLDGSDACATGDTGWSSGPLTDHDSDGCRDTSEDSDDDDDGVIDGTDACSQGATGWTSGPATDHDSDGCRDSSEDVDDDADGVADGIDACPTGQALGVDHDGDGCKNGAEDPDEDDDGVLDGADGCAVGELGWTSLPGSDHDSDGCRDAGEDTDDDADAVGDGSDHCELIPGPASSGCPLVERSLSLRYRRRAGAFRGRLYTEANACAADQLVTVFRRLRGPDRPIGSDLTNAAGRYSLDRRRRSGRYYSRVAERTIDDLATCEGATSPTHRRR